jgi:hypothetical protein
MKCSIIFLLSNTRDYHNFWDKFTILQLRTMHKHNSPITFGVQFMFYLFLLNDEHSVTKCLH